LGVAGRYYIDGSLAGSMERAQKVAETLIAQTRTAAPPASPAKKQS
jgi:thiol:disulfide interchange protein DsbA